MFLLESMEVAELLSDAEENFASVNVAAIPLDQLASAGNVLCNRLLGQNVFAGSKSLFDVCRLSRDW
jgi:hypothetical protein